MLQIGRDLFLQDAFKVGLISAPENHASIECLIWDMTPDGADVQIDPGVVVPDAVRLSVVSLEVNRRCAVVQRMGCRLHLAFVR